MVSRYIQVGLVGHQNMVEPIFACNVRQIHLLEYVQHRLLQSLHKQRDVNKQRLHQLLVQIQLHNQKLEHHIPSFLHYPNQVKLHRRFHKLVAMHPKYSQTNHPNKGQSHHHIQVQQQLQLQQQELLLQHQLEQRLVLQQLALRRQRLVQQLLVQQRFQQLLVLGEFFLLPLFFQLLVSQLLRVLFSRLLLLHELLLQVF